MPIEVIMVVITIAKVPIVGIAHNLSIMVVPSRIVASSGIVAARDSSTFVVSATSIHTVVIATAGSHVATAAAIAAAAVATAGSHVATTTAVSHVATAATIAATAAIATAATTAAASHVATAATIAAAAAIAAAATPTAVLDKGDCAAVTKHTFKIRRTCRLSRLPNEC